MFMKKFSLIKMICFLTILLHFLISKKKTKKKTLNNILDLSQKVKGILNDIHAKIPKNVS